MCSETELPPKVEESQCFVFVPAIFTPFFLRRDRERSWLRCVSVLGLCLLCSIAH